jgi:hypothetical protein
VYEDLLNIKGETESTMRRFNATILKLSESLEKEGQERNEFIERIPKTIEIRPSEDYLNLNKAFEKNSKFMKNYLLWDDCSIIPFSFNNSRKHLFYQAMVCGKH